MQNIIIILIVTLLTLFLITIFIKNKKIKLSLGIILITFIMGISSFLCIPIFKKINYGLDLQGGFEVLYQIDSLDGNNLTKDMVYNTYKAILKRVDIVGVNEPIITIENDNRIRIALAGVKNPDEAREKISTVAVLSFRDSNDNLLMTSDVLDKEAKITTDNFGRPAVALSIKDHEKFYDVTNRVKDMTNNVIVIWLDYEEGVDSYFKEQDSCGSLSTSKCLSAARVNEAFSSDVIIQGGFSEKEAKSLVELINSGSLPTKLTEISSRTIPAQYGESSLNKTLFAGVIGLIIVILILIVLYRFAGFIAGSMLTLYMMMSFLVFHLIDGTLTLPGIAAMLLGIGMAVDASIITFERIKDQLKIGKSLKEATILGNKESFSSILDANVTTIIVAIILFILGESSVKGFATMLIISIILTVLIMVFLTKYIITKFASSSFFKDKITLFIGLSKNKIEKAKEIRIPFKNIDFVKNSKKILITVLIIIIVGLSASLYRKFNFAVDFTGGTSINVLTDKDVLLDSKYHVRKTDKASDNVTIVIDEVLNKDEIKTLGEEIKNKYDAESDIFVVSPIVKKELTKNAIISLLIAVIGIVLYVSVRFKFNYAVSAIIALLHDVLITLIFFGLFNLEIDSIFIAAILTIIGYSINDTIVTFDMVRKNLSKRKEVKENDIDNIVNDSIRLTFFRTIMTTVTTLVPIFALIILGSSAILNFNLALLVGFVAGVFSSIYISNALWIILEKRRMKKPIKKDKDIDEIDELEIKGINC